MYQAFRYHKVSFATLSCMPQFYFSHNRVWGIFHLQCVFRWCCHMWNCRTERIIKFMCESLKSHFSNTKFNCLLTHWTSSWIFERVKFYPDVPPVCCLWMPFASWDQGLGRSHRLVTWRGWEKWRDPHTHDQTLQVSFMTELCLNQKTFKT